MDFSAADLEPAGDADPRRGPDLHRPRRPHQDHARRRRPRGRLRPGHRLPLLRRQAAACSPRSSPARPTRCATAVVGASADERRRSATRSPPSITTVGRVRSRGHPALAFVCRARARAPAAATSRSSARRGAAHRGRARRARVHALPRRRARHAPRRVARAHHALVSLQSVRELRHRRPDAQCVRSSPTSSSPVSSTPKECPDDHQQRD